MATIPTLLYYLSIFLMIEADSRRLGTRAGASRRCLAVGELTRRYGYHFTSLLAIAVLMVARHVGVPRRVLGDLLALRAQLRRRRETALRRARLSAALRSRRRRRARRSRPPPPPPASSSAS